MDGSGNIPIHTAASIGDCDVVEMLIKQGTDVDAVNNEGDHRNQGAWLVFCVFWTMEHR